MKINLTKENESPNLTKLAMIEKGKPGKEYNSATRWEKILESNLCEKMAMAFELYNMGFSEEAVDKILHFQMKTKDWGHMFGYLAFYGSQ